MILRSVSLLPSVEDQSLLTLPSTALEWPTLTTQWFPDVKDVKEKNYRVHRLLIGTHTAEGKPNYLQIAEV